jgi:hypothetical protein
MEKNTMKRLNVLVPEVDGCEVSACGYNVSGACHAKAITVGDGTHPRCDTFVPLVSHTHLTSTAGVGACKVTSCRHNQDLECMASAILVVTHDDHADCATFTR